MTLSPSWSMATETVTISREEYEQLLEEVGILRNKEMKEAIEESDAAKRQGVKTWKLNLHA